MMKIYPKVELDLLENQNRIPRQPVEQYHSKASCSPYDALVHPLSLVAADECSSPHYLQVGLKNDSLR